MKHPSMQIIFEEHSALTAMLRSGRPPAGAFYIYADASRFTNDSFAFAFRLLNEAGVACAPGKDFGQFRANHYLRFAFTRSVDQLSAGISRLKSFLS